MCVVIATTTTNFYFFFGRVMRDKQTDWNASKIWQSIIFIYNQKIKNKTKITRFNIISISHKKVEIKEI